MTDNEDQVKDEPQIVDVTITAPDADWLRQHCAMLIEKRLAASANIIPAIDSIYRWQGEIHHATEAYAILHTVDSCFGEIVEQTTACHPYDTVHILATPIQQADVGYRSWILASVGQKASGPSNKPCE